MPLDQAGSFEIADQVFCVPTFVDLDLDGDNGDYIW